MLTQKTTRLERYKNIPFMPILVYAPLGVVIIIDANPMNQS